MECLSLIKRTWVHKKNRGSRICSGGYLFGVFILACCQHINSLTAVLNIKDLVLGHHPILVLLKSKGRGINKICNVSMFSFQNLCLCFVISGVRVIEFLEKTVPNWADLEKLRNICSIQIYNMSVYNWLSSCSIPS